MQNGRLAAGQRAFEGRAELLAGFHPLAMAAEGARVVGEVGVLSAVAETRPG